MVIHNLHTVTHKFLFAKLYSEVLHLPGGAWQEGSAIEPHVTRILEGLYHVLLSYHAYVSRLDRLKQTLKDLVKPDNITKFAYIDIE